MMSDTEKEIDDFLKIFGTSLRHYTFGDTKQRAVAAWNTRTPDPRVIKLVEAARETVTKLDDFFGSYVFPFDNFKEVEALRTALKAMEQSDY